MSEPSWDGPSFGFSALSEQPWRKEAACRGRDVNLFFPDPTDRAGTKIAKDICAQCPSRDACLDFGYENSGGEGIFGGFTATERRRMIGKRKTSHDYRSAM